MEIFMWLKNLRELNYVAIIVPLHQLVYIVVRFQPMLSMMMQTSQ
ncbi:hypothetical protein GBAR_LOCUS29496 [Geodia barretti]|uniref:Uncharacterized protein n=1 Tax=Geodia barretti TaxID=519541 RepID=A0AA35TU80_GEOBA|nr:hypothetical protein GBAR_LOCUS29496 [Geodia barretti]